MAHLTCNWTLPLLLCIAILICCGPCVQGSTSTTPSGGDDNEVKEQMSTSALDHRTVLVLSITFPAALVVGALWCYCMTAVCDIRQPSQKPSMKVSRSNIHEVYPSSTQDEDDVDDDSRPPSAQP